MIHTRDTNCFDFLRLFAAFAVLIGHATHHLNLSFFWVSPSNGFWFHDGVPLFFVLSGFLIYRSYVKCVESNRPIWQFYMNRFLRIVPAIYAYAIASTLLLLVVGVLAIDSLWATGFIAWFMSNVFLVPVYHPTILKAFGIGVFNGSLWTIPVEVSFYLSIPLIYWCQKRFGFKWLTAILCFISLTGLTLTSMYSEELLIMKLFNISFVPHLLLFGLGVFWSRMWELVPRKWYLALLCVMFYLVFRHWIGITLGPLRDFLWAIPFSYAVLWIGFNLTFLNRITRFGDISYGVYIWHMVVVNTFLYLNLHQKLLWLSETGVIITIFVLTTGIALLSWWFIEKPSLQLKPFSSRGNLVPTHKPESVVSQRM